MCLIVSMYPHVANGLKHTYNTWGWLFIVRLCVCMCPCAPMWSMIWFTAVTSNTQYTLCTHVSACAHVPQCGQWLDTCLLTLRLVGYCELMCLYVLMCPNLANGLIYTYKLRDWLLIMHSCVCMCPCAPMWPMVWYILINSETDF